MLFFVWLVVIFLFDLMIGWRSWSQHQLWRLLPVDSTLHDRDCSSLMHSGSLAWPSSMFSLSWWRLKHSWIVALSTDRSIALSFCSMNQFPKVHVAIYHRLDYFRNILSPFLRLISLISFHSDHAGLDSWLQHIHTSWAVLYFKASPLHQSLDP